MADDNVLDQGEIERLLGGMGGGAPETPAPTPEAAPSEPGGVLNQSELDALFAGGGGGATAPETPPASGGPIGQAELDALFGGGSTPAVTPQPSATPSAPASSKAFGSSSGFGARGAGMAASPAAASFGGPMPEINDDGDDEDGIPRGDIDYLLDRADDSLRSIASSNLNLPAEVIEFQFPEFGGTVPSTEHATLDQISEVELDVKIELGRTNMYLEDVLKLRKGSVVPLDKMAGDAVDIYVNGRLLARGEVLVMNENFCVRVAELLAGAIPME